MLLHQKRSSRVGGPRRADGAPLSSVVHFYHFQTTVTLLGRCAPQHARPTEHLRTDTLRHTIQGGLKMAHVFIRL